MGWTFEWFKISTSCQSWLGIALVGAMVVFPTTTTTTATATNDFDNTDNNDNDLVYTASERYKFIVNEKHIHTDDTKLPNKTADLGSWSPGDFLSGPFAARYPPLIKEMDLGSVRPGQIPDRFHQSTVL